MVTMFSRKHTRNALLFTSISLAATACGNPDSTWRDAPVEGQWTDDGASDEIEGDAPGEEPGHPAEMHPAPALISAELEVRNGELVVELANPTQHYGMVSATANVMNAQGMFHTERALDLRLEAGETTELVLSPDVILGLDVAGQPWSKVTLNYSYELEDGHAGGDWRSLFVEGGQVAPERHIDVVNGTTYGYPEPEPPAAEETIDKQAATFRICFENEVPLFGGAQNDLSVFRPATTNQRINGQLVDSLRSSTGFHSVGPGSRLSNGCTEALPRNLGSWSAIVFAAATDTVGTLDIVADPPTSQSISFNVSSTSIVNGIHVQRVRFTGTNALAMQQAFVLSQFTLTRMNGSGVVTDLGNKTLFLVTGSGSGASFYSHFNSTARHPQQITVQPGDASKRSTISHETGHFIHLNTVFPNTSSKFALDYSYTLSPAPNDNCQRSSSSHALASVEYKSSAHIEAMGHLIVALTYNNQAAAGTVGSCRWPDFGPNASCSGDSTFQADTIPNPTFDAVIPRKFLKTFPNDPGLPAGCAEWNSTPLFAQVGNEVDWTRHYWDYFSQSPRPEFKAYLAQEKSVCGTVATGGSCSQWTNINHFEKIRGKLTAAQDAQWMAAARRHLFD